MTRVGGHHRTPNVPDVLFMALSASLVENANISGIDEAYIRRVKGIQHVRWHVTDETMGCKRQIVTADFGEIIRGLHMGFFNRQLGPITTVTGGTVTRIPVWMRLLDPDMTAKTGFAIIKIPARIVLWPAGKKE